MLTKEISDVEKELELEFESKYPLDGLDHIKRKDKLIHLRAKLSTLKYCQAKFDKFKQEVKKLLIQHTNLCIKQNKVEIAGYLSGFHTEFDKLSSKQEEKE
jgi:hypothetical protein